MVTGSEQSIPKFHHFVAIMHSRRFTDKSGRFHFFSKQIGKVLYQKPENVFAQNHLNTVVDASGNKDASAEGRFSDLEGRANKIIAKIVVAARKNKRPMLTPEEKLDWDRYFFLQFKRTPDVHQKIATLKEQEVAFKEILASVKARRPDAAAAIDALDTEIERKRFMQAGKVAAIERPGGMAFDEIAKRGLHVARISSSGTEFLIGSAPIVAKGDLRHDRAERWLPVASDVVVGIGGNRGDEAMFRIDDADQILEFNRIVASQSTSFAAASKDLVALLANELREPLSSADR